MENQFYNDFDQECYCDAQNAARTRDHRSVFSQDRDRILFTNSFRRLQAKTQVFQAGEYDFYRTRLTHSLEVSTIAKSICAQLLAHSPLLSADFHIDPDLVEAICLAHDIGHPPFGHAGERILNELMTPYGGFEGNAQSLRILTRTIYSSTRGMGPSRSLLDGILKYKRLYRDRHGDHNHFVYDDQEPFFDFCFGANRPDSEFDIDFKSLECQIMDTADDIAYSCCDIVDGVKARFITLEKIFQWQEGEGAKLNEFQKQKLEKLIDRIKRGHLDASMSKVIGELVASCSLEETTNFMTPRSNRYRFKLVMAPDQLNEIKLYKKLSSTFVFGSPALQQIEYKGGRLLRSLTEAFKENYITTINKKTKLVPQGLHELVVSTPDATVRARLICDYLSGMTDAYAVRTYKRLFDPDYGSISELM
ncbi:MAG: hypothetical protein B9S32_15475 [Verrucomicrobia bacterium Tous-C9LFEB]|nr:MAG: hypothetical protein B9S32_15475 [Verrucomicrobia bacterium Tous-C9LFEB]